MRKVDEPQRATPHPVIILTLLANHAHDKHDGLLHNNPNKTFHGYDCANH